VAFDPTGNKFVSASADATARIYTTSTGALLHELRGHELEVSKVSFNPPGTKLITASSDKTCRLWDARSGECLQVGVMIAVLVPRNRSVPVPFCSGML
jgi:dynein assembly factor with WDR repeat domains 1